MTAHSYCPLLLAIGLRGVLICGIKLFGGIKHGCKLVLCPNDRKHRESIPEWPVSSAGVVEPPERVLGCHFGHPASFFGGVGSDRGGFGRTTSRGADACAAGGFASLVTSRGLSGLGGCCGQVGQALHGSQLGFSISRTRQDFAAAPQVNPSQISAAGWAAALASARMKVMMVRFIAGDSLV